jgi:hypothetical protein
MSDINEKAVVCPICRRDLQFAAPIWKRVNELEGDLTRFISKVDDIKVEINCPHTKREAKLAQLFHVAKLISLYLILSIVLLALTKDSSVLANFFLFWLYSAVNSLFGSAAGFSKPNEPRRYYFLVALAFALLDIALRGSTYHWEVAEALVFLVSDILWFWSGYVLGQKLRGWASEGQTYSSEGFQLARFIGNSPTEVENAAPNGPTNRDSAKEVIRLLTPLALSIVSTIISTMVKK